MASKTDTDSKERPIVLADPRSFMRDCLACWLNEFGGGLQAIVTSDAAATLAQFQAPGAGAVILSVPAHAEGLTWLRDQTGMLRAAAPALPIVLLMDGPDLAAGQDAALRLGLQGYIPVASATQIVVAALRLVVAGGCYFPHVLATERRRPVASGESSHARMPGKQQLTARERAVFELLTAGLSNKLIARQLEMALSTVKIHVHHILKKLNVQNRTEVAIWGRTRASSSGEKFVERRRSGQTALHEMR